MIAATLRDRFDDKWTPEPNTGCWLWLAAGGRGGYGVIKLPHSKKNSSAHRVAFELYVGPVPPGMCVLHRCDTRACVNPAHLFLGTYEDNAHDMIRKGRAIRPDVAILTAAAARKNNAKTHCRYDHELTPENTFITGQGYRRCRQCYADVREMAKSGLRRSRGGKK